MMGNNARKKAARRRQELFGSRYTRALRGVGFGEDELPRYTARIVYRDYEHPVGSNVIADLYTGKILDWPGREEGVPPPEPIEPVDVMLIYGPGAAQEDVPFERYVGQIHFQIGMFLYRLFAVVRNPRSEQDYVNALTRLGWRVVGKAGEGSWVVSLCPPVFVAMVRQPPGSETDEVRCGRLECVACSRGDGGSKLVWLGVDVVGTHPEGARGGPSYDVECSEVEDGCAFDFYGHDYARWVVVDPESGGDVYVDALRAAGWIVKGRTDVGGWVVEPD